MEPAWVGAQGETERRLWSTVVQKAAVELTERAREISDAVTGYISERLPDLLDNAEALEANRASTEASIRDFAEVLRSVPIPLQAVSLGSATLDYRAGWRPTRRTADHVDAQLPARPRGDVASTSGRSWPRTWRTPTN